MILEVAVFNIKKGQGPAFEKAMAKAKKVISASPGFRGLKISASVENPGRYMLRVCWNTVEDHMVTFRQSDRFKEWRSHIQDFLDGAPVVEHFNAPFEIVPQQ
ncbi:MAG: antibiotic biosynthesis monooxygenase family protein [Rhodospirillales bacterium]